MFDINIPKYINAETDFLWIFTKRQFIIVAVTSAVCLFLLLSKVIAVGMNVRLIIILFIGAVGVFWAYIPYNNIMFEKWIVIFIQYFFQPKTYHWKKTVDNYRAAKDDKNKK